MTVRTATHAGSWYSSEKSELIHQLQACLNKATSENRPVRDARLIISPHAGYRYCGATMAYSYASLNINKNIKRIFILGPSHHVYFKNEVLLSGFDQLDTPLGRLNVDVEMNKELIKLGDKKFDVMSRDVDEEEHSLEMQYPMLVQTLSWRGIDLDDIKVVPILVSHNSENIDSQIGKILLPYIRDKSNLFIISSDFCHWGRRFQFTGYVSEEKDLDDAIEEETEIEMLTARSKLPHHKIPIWKSIEILDKYGMKTLTNSENSNKYDNWKKYLEISGNTICGANPFSIILASFKNVNENIEFHWPKYAQSSQVEHVDDSSVSYASGYAIIP